MKLIAKQSIALFLFLAIQVSGVAGQFILQRNGVTFSIVWDNSPYSLDPINGYILTPSWFNYHENAYNKKPGQYYYYINGEYQGDHYYWGGCGLFDTAWYMYQIHNTEGICFAAVTVDSTNRIGSFSDVDNLWTSLGLQRDGGPDQLDTADTVPNGHHYYSYNSNFHFAGMLDAVVVKVPWANVFSGSTEVTVDGETFVQLQKHSLTSLQTVGGTVSCDKPLGFPGEVATMTAVPSAGYVFSGWTGDFGGGSLSTIINNTTTYTFGNKNATIIANFRPTDPPPVETSAAGLRQRLGVFDPISKSFHSISSDFHASGHLYILVHGWANEQLGWANIERADGRFPLIWNDSPWSDDWIAMAVAITSKDPKAQILSFSWIDRNATDKDNLFGASISRSAADQMGGVLYSAMQEVGISSTFSMLEGNTLHLIGFSHGALIVAKAAVNAALSSIRVDQLTLLESPELEATWFAGAKNFVDETLKQLIKAERAGFIPFVANVVGDESVLKSTGDLSLGNGLGKASSIPGVYNCLMPGGHSTTGFTTLINEGSAIGVPWNPSSVSISTSAALQSSSIDPTTVESGVGVVKTNDHVDLDASTQCSWNTSVTTAQGDQALVFKYHFTNPNAGGQLGVILDGASRLLTQNIDTPTDNETVAIDIGNLTQGQHSVLFYTTGVASAGTNVQLSQFSVLSIPAPTIAIQPSEIQLCVGQSASLSVTASGGPILSYQWFKDGSAILGATNSVYTIGSPQLSDAGTYWVVVTNSAGSTSSEHFQVTMNVSETDVPTLPPWALAGLAAALLAVGLWAIRPNAMQS